jgi:5'-deoxynucleotidase YfbR-like HD superfamily hydrolase
LYDAKTKQVLTQQDQVNRVWSTLTPDQQATVAGAYSQDLYRTNPFAETTKNIAVTGQQGGILGQMTVAPLTGITLPIAKATSGQKVSAQDIEGAVITAVGDVLMIGGGFEAVTTVTNAAGEVVASSAAPAVKVITSSLLTGMGAVGVVNTVMQVKTGKTAGSTLAVEAALSVAALVGGAGGLVSSIVPKGTPDIDVAQQFVNGIKDQTTPEGLAKNSPFQAPSNISGDTELGEPDVETAGQQAEITASYKEWTQAASELAQNQHDINDLTAKIADNRTTLDAITQSSAPPDEYVARLASDTAKMDSTLTKLKAADDDLSTKVNDAGEQFKTTAKSYNTYAKESGLAFNDSAEESMIKNLPKDSAANIKATVNQLMNGDNSPAAIAEQQAKVDALNAEFKKYVGKAGQSSDIAAELADEQSKLNLMKIGNLQQAQSELINAREELADVKEIEDNGKLDKVTKQNLVKIQNQLESQINDREAILADVISGKGMQDIIKIEDITDADGDVIGKRMYTNDGVFRYDVDEDGNIIESSKTEESSGGGDSPNTPTETRPSPDTTTPEETGLQQTSRGMPKGGIINMSAIGAAVVTVPTVKIGKNGEVPKPSTKTQTTTTKTTEVPLKQPATNPSKTPVEVPQKITNPAINPAINPATQTPVTNPSKTPSKTQVVSPAISPATVQSQIQSQTKGIQPAQGQQMSKAQQISNKTAAPTQIKTDTITTTKTIVIPPPVAAELPNTEGGTKLRAVPKDAFGTVTWKQGFGWYARWYPYRQQDSTFVKNQPKGATQIANAHSAYDTIQTLTGMPPSKVPQFDMGIEEVGIKAPPHNPTVQNRASISFQRNSLAKGRRMPKPNDLGAGIVETKTKYGRRRHLRLS